MTFNGQVPFIRQAARGVSEHNLLSVSFFFLNWDFVSNIIKGGIIIPEASLIGGNLKWWDDAAHSTEETQREISAFYLHINIEIRF